MLQEIVSLAAQLGKIQPDPSLWALCQTAQTELKAQLRPNLSPESCPDAFRLAAAWIALANYTLSAQDNFSSFSAGDVSLHAPDATQKANALRLQAKQVMRPFLRDESFAFWSVTPI